MEGRGVWDLSICGWARRCFNESRVERIQTLGKAPCAYAVYTYIGLKGAPILVL